VSTTNANGRLVTRKGFSAVPFFGDLVAMARMLRDRDAGWAMKLTALATLLYVVCPIDALPEGLAPAIGWLDDVGLVVILRLALAKKLDVYRYPLFEKAPARPAELGSSGLSPLEARGIEVREIAEPARAAPVRG
jgi:uncharacterized membrane protein YkvA (DUF1232 family)